MIVRSRRNSGRYLYAGIIIGVAFLFISGCTVRSSTTYIKAPMPNITNPIHVGQSCLDKAQFNEEFDNKNNDQLEPLRVTYKDKKELLMNVIRDIIDEKEVSCTKRKEPLAYLSEKLKTHHEGLLDKNLTREQALVNLKNAVGESRYISVSFEEPGSLAMSARAFPSEQEPGGVFASMKERAQAAVIDYAQTFANTATSTPEKAVESLLKSVSPTREPKVAETEKVELTISTALNSASIGDRFDYISAYLSLPSLPESLNAGTYLERELLTRFQIINMGRLPAERERYRESDIRADLLEALDYLRVRIESIDNLKTEPAIIQLGSIKSAATLGMEAGVKATDVIPIGVKASLSSEREDKISKELDKRSFWLDKDRTLLRIIQRGMQEATISGSFSSALTLKIPKTDLYVITLDTEREGKNEKRLMVKLENVEQPLYGSINAVGVVLGTVRVAITSSDNIFVNKRESDGIGYTVMEDPLLLNLWINKRILWSLDLQDIDPQLYGTQKGFRSVGIYSTDPIVRQIAYFKDSKSVWDFVSALREKKLKLIERKTDKGTWYEISSCTDKAGEPQKKDRYKRDKPEPGKIWLGVETKDGLSQGLESDYKLPREALGGCPKTKSEGKRAN